MLIVKANIWGKKVSHSLAYKENISKESQDVSSEPQSSPQIIVRGGNQLRGEIKISGAKNAALKLMAAALLTDQKLHLSNMPNSLGDIHSQVDLLRHLGTKIDVNASNMTLNCGNIVTYDAPYELVRKMRASTLVLGPLLARFGTARISLPGGCEIGMRPIDMHLSALKDMGAQILLEDGYVQASLPEGQDRLQGADITFAKVSVGATENIMMAATLARGTTTLHNAAREPEIANLGECLIAMGAQISGLGTSTITIHGVESLHGAQAEILPDRIEAGTYMAAVAMTGGEVILKNACLDHLTAFAEPLSQTGVDITQSGNDIIVKRDLQTPLKPIDIETQPFPGFPTDLQAQFLALLTLAHGTSHVTETIFENRFMHVPELARMGANISVDGHTAAIKGGAPLKGAEVMATDLRASVALVLAGLVADGQTSVNRIYHLDRGYEDLTAKLAACGADIKRI